jgi:hypothetical protein
MSATNLIAVFAENRSGQTARITGILAAAGVNLRWATIATSGSFGVMKFLVDKTKAGVQALTREGLMVSLLPIVAVRVHDQPGALQRVAEALSKNHINLENCSGFVTNKQAVVLVETHEVAKAGKVLLSEGFQLLTEEQMLRL